MSKAPNTDDLEIAVTGTAWMGGGIGSVQSAIEELFNAANNEIQIAVYEMTTGAENFLNRLQVCLAKGVRVTIIVNRYPDKPLSIRKRLEKMSQKFPYFTLLSFEPKTIYEDLHAKIIVVDRKRALVGSANLTWRGLVGNHELATIVSGSVASKIACLLDKLSRDSRVIKPV